jgi:hypothetical protein
MARLTWGLYSVAIEPEAVRAYLAPFVLHSFYVDVFAP